MAKLVNVAVSEAVGVQSLRVRVSLRALKKATTMNFMVVAFLFEQDVKMNHLTAEQSH